MKAKEFLSDNLRKESVGYFGHDDPRWLSDVCDAWMNDESNSKHRFDAIRVYVDEADLKECKILDMASGCGTFVFYGLLNKYDVYGIEPEQWKHEFNALKAKEKNYPDAWVKRFCSGVGENLPYGDETIDIISTYQTLEHVQSHEKCFSEFKRVLKKGGRLFIQCPDYTSFFEGHYRVPMLPLMNRSLFRAYLRLLDKPTKGLDTVNYITQGRVSRFLGNDFDIENISLNHAKDHLKKKLGVSSDLLARMYMAYGRMFTFLSSEKSVHVMAVKK